MNQLFPKNTPFIIGRSMGGGGDGGEEAPNSLKSNQTARLLDLLGEGPIVGPWNGLSSIYYEGVPVKRKGTDDKYNFDNFTISGNSGYPSQPPLKGFENSETEIGVQTRLYKGSPITKRISAAETDRCRITVSLPSLMVAKENGNIKGLHVKFDLMLATNNGGYQKVATLDIDGKTNTRYQMDYVFHLDEFSNAGPPWDVRLIRVTDDSVELGKQDELWWDSYTEIIDAKINYTNSAIMAHIVRARDFSSIPKRVYEVGGLLISYPSNYNPSTRVYTGVWNGLFAGPGYCNNPVWVFYDLIVTSRYGIGAFIKPADVDKWELYEIAKWCDEPVLIGKGTETEPRWTFNGVINTRQEAYDLLANVASVWRGSAFWAGGLLVPTCDRIQDPVFLFTNANVIDGRFSYQSADIRTRHNQIAVAWNDPKNLGEKRLAIVEDRTAIAKSGVLDTQIVAMGCTSESMAQRVGEWMMYTENYEGDTCVFETGFEGAFVRPGNILKISDVTVAGTRRSGRIVARTNTTITLDAPVTLAAGIAYSVSFVRPSGAVVTMGCSAAVGTPVSVLSLSGTLGVDATTWPVIDSLWMLSSSDLEPTIWRTISAKKVDQDRFEISAMTHNDSKWGYIERGSPLSDPDISNFGAPPALTNVEVIDFLYPLSPISVGVKMLISWESQAPYFDVFYREVDGPWIRLEAISQKSIEVLVEEYDYEIWITPRDELGHRGDTTRLTYTVIGRTAPPAIPANFRVQQVNGVAMFQWAPSAELDVVIGGSFEMRYSPKLTADVNWTSANTVITSIPGTATTVELPYRPGTYFLRAKDITGLMSAEPAKVYISGLDPDFTQFIRICEQPLYTGVKVNTALQMPQEWLVLSGTNTEGTYTFANQLDIGGVFTIRITVDMLAFPFIPGTGFIDVRPGLVDTWQNWDDAASDGNGMVTVRVRQTDDDPASPTASWGPWAQFVGGDYTGRGFQFQAWLAAPTGQNVGVEELCIIADVSEKNDHGAGVTWVPNKMSIVYDVKFYGVPAISVAILQGIVGDTFRITNKTRTGFDLELIGSTGAIITGARTFDWIAQGY